MKKEEMSALMEKRSASSQSEDILKLFSAMVAKAKDILGLEVPKSPISQIGTAEGEERVEKIREYLAMKDEFNLACKKRGIACPHIGLEDFV